MPKNKLPEDLSVEELRRLLVEKRRTSRQGRLEHFRKTDPGNQSWQARGPVCSFQKNTEPGLSRKSNFH